jgi:hypothetical protein
MSFRYISAAPSRSLQPICLAQHRLPEALVAEIEAESRIRKLSKSDVIRERFNLDQNLERTLTVIERPV